MKLAPVLFRFRVAVFVLLHVIGFLAPWNYFSRGSQTSLWLVSSTLLNRTAGLNLAATTLTVTLLGLACLVTGTAFRLCATAYLGPNIMRGTIMQGEHLVAAGPYAYVRNPLYLGAWLLALATSLLMPPDGAAFFLVAYSAFFMFLIMAEESFLTGRMGNEYLQYCRNVPRLLPRLRAHSSGVTAPPRWLRAVLNEIYPVGFTLCFAIFAWRYNARILIRCLLICYGVSLVVRALSGTATTGTTSETTTDTTAA